MEERGGGCVQLLEEDVAFVTLRPLARGRVDAAKGATPSFLRPRS